ncbi:trefoil (P-type) domain-containing protein [Phthorimaea operculella]|nr:trefoil (P-type) domain-containing protein [Phthorimaea operculella]
MPKIPYKPEKQREDDEDYEIVSFEEFCDKSGGSKTDLLTLNDNINYRLCYESDKGLNFEGESSSKDAGQSETSLSGKNVAFKRKTSGSFAPFGRYNGKAQKGSLFGGVIPKPKTEVDTSGNREQHRYQRFSGRRNICQRIWDYLPGMGSGILGLALVCALCVGVWWAVCGALGGAWGEEHYRKLWERAHPDNIKKPLSPIPFEKTVAKMPPLMTHSEPVQIPEYRYHDHNNLSTKNKNATVETKKKENKKSYVELSKVQLAEICSNIQVPDIKRFDCAPGGNKDVCQQRGCCWDSAHKAGAPYCFYPPDYNTFRSINMTENKHGMRVMYSRGRPSGYPGDFNTVALDFKYLSDD